MTTFRASRDSLVPLIGRAELVSDIAGERVVVLIAQPGAGKSRVLAELRATAPEHVVVTVRCHRGVVSTYEPLEALVESANRQLKNAPGKLARMPTDDADRLVALRERLEAIADTTPVLLQIDDLHWAPRAALDAIAFCIDRTRDASIRWQLTTRPMPETPDPLDALRREPDCRIVDLPLLSVAETAELARMLGSDAEPELHRLTGGNPLYIEQWLLARTRPGSASTLRAALEVRIGDIPERATEIAALVALAERPLSIAELSTAARKEPDAVRAIVDDLAALGVFRVDDDRVEFAHDLLRGTCASMLPEERRAVVHGELVGIARNDVERARHLVAAHRGEEAQQAYLDAARSAMYDFAFAEVTEIVKRLRVLPTLTAASKWQVGAIDAILYNVRFGFPQERMQIDELLATRTCVDSATAAFFILHMLAVSGTPTAGFGPLVIDAMIAAPDIEIADKASFYRHRAIILYTEGKFAEGIEMIDSVLATGQVPARHIFELRCMRALLCAPSSIDEARADLIALANDPANADFPSYDFVYLVLGQLAVALDDMEAQIHWSQLGLASRGRVRESFYTLWAIASLWLGDLSKTLDVSEAFLGWAQSRGMSHQPTPLTIHVEAYVWSGLFERARDLLAGNGFTSDARLKYAYAVLAEHEGRFDDALPLYTAFAAGVANGERGFEAPSTVALVRIHALRGDLARAGAAYARLPEDSWQSHPDRKYRVESEFYFAIASGDATLARSILATFADARVMVLRRAVALATFGERFRDREALFEAVAVFAASGAKLYEERTRKTARGFGFRFGSKSAAQNVLTDREADIARFIAAGRTNREIADTLHISPKTVAANIGAILEKYGLRSRVEIAANIAAGKPFERVAP